MKIAWSIALISAFTDFLIAAGGAYTSAVVAFPNQKFDGEQWELCLVLGVIAFARRIQHILEQTPEGAAASVALTSGVTVSKTTMVGTTETKTEAPDPNAKETK